MAYAATVSGPVVSSIDGKRYLTYTITETDIGTNDMVEVAIGVQHFTVTLFEADLTVAGSAATIDPELFTADNATPANMLNTLSQVSVTATAAAYHRVQDDVRVYSATGSLHLHSKPDTATGASGEIVTRITVTPGHL